MFGGIKGLGFRELGFRVLGLGLQPLEKESFFFWSASRMLSASHPHTQCRWSFTIKGLMGSVRGLEFGVGAEG